MRTSTLLRIIRRRGLPGLMLGGLVGVATTVAAQPAEPAVPDPSSPETTTTQPPTAEPPTPVRVTPQPPPQPLACEPACPAGASCIEGQCYVACDSGSGQCDEVLDPTPPPPEQPQREVVIYEEPEVEADTEDDDEPDADALRGLDLRIAPGVGACLGSGCQQVRVGFAAGSIGMGGSLDLRLAYRATPHLSIELGGLTSFHGNDIDASPLSMWMAAVVGPRLHLTGGRWRAEPVVGFHVGYARAVVRWTNAGFSQDGLALGGDVGVRVRVSERLSMGMVTGATAPYWGKLCEADAGTRDCYGRSELDHRDLRRFFWTTSAVLTLRLR